MPASHCGHAGDWSEFVRAAFFGGGNDAGAVEIGTSTCGDVGSATGSALVSTASLGGGAGVTATKVAVMGPSPDAFELPSEPLGAALAVSSSEVGGAMASSAGIGDGSTMALGGGGMA